MQIIDQMGRTVRIPAQPLRIISLVPSQTELLHYLGLSEEVVGITKFCVHPKTWWRSKPRIGGTKKYHFDRIADLKPNLIIGNKEENEQQQIEQLQEQYPTWMSDILTLSDALDMITAIGKMTQREVPAQQLVREITCKFQQLKNTATPTTPESSSRQDLRVAYLIWQNPYMVAGQDTFINEMLQWTGFKNAFNQLSRYPTITEEQLKITAPDLIFLSSEPFPFKEKHIKELARICPKAVIKLVDGEAFSWYGSRLLHTATYLRNLSVDHP